MTFRVHERVVYIGGIVPTVYGECLPTKDCVYTIRAVRDFGQYGCGVHLNEIKNPPLLYMPDNTTYEAYLNASYFRRVVEATTDISFTEGAPKDSEQFDNRRKVGVEV